MNSNHWILTNLQSGEVNIHHFQPHWVKFLFHINIPHGNQRITCNLFLSIYQKMVRYVTLEYDFLFSTACLFSCLKVNNSWWSLLDWPIRVHKKHYSPVHYTINYYIDTDEIPGFFLFTFFHRVQWRYYFYLSCVRILVLPWLLTWLANYKKFCNFIVFYVGISSVSTK